MVDQSFRQHRPHREPWIRFARSPDRRTETKQQTSKVEAFTSTCGREEKDISATSITQKHRCFSDAFSVYRHHSLRRSANLVTSQQPSLDLAVYRDYSAPKDVCDREAVATRQSASKFSGQPRNPESICVTSCSLHCRDFGSTGAERRKLNAANRENSSASKNSRRSSASTPSPAASSSSRCWRSGSSSASICRWAPRACSSSGRGLLSAFSFPVAAWISRRHRSHQHHGVHPHPVEPLPQPRWVRAEPRACFGMCRRDRPMSWPWSPRRAERPAAASFTSVPRSLAAAASPALAGALFAASFQTVAAPDLRRSQDRL